MGGTADAPSAFRDLPSRHDHPTKRRSDMPRYVVERTFPDGLAIPVDRITLVRVLAPYLYA
jgi:hypothetical protein